MRHALALGNLGINMEIVWRTIREYLLPRMRRRKRS
jgi:uncharacterized protein with HEPN domain